MNKTNPSKQPIFYIDRKTGKLEKESIYREVFLRLFYGPKYGRFLAAVVSKFSLFSSLYGLFQHSRISKRKIDPFIRKYHIDLEMFEKPIDGYSSFNDFFTRKLKRNSRALEGELIIPADGRYLIYQNIDELDGFFVKGKKFSIEKLLLDSGLAKKYKNGDMVIARLCPTDYHRFHFPCDCKPSETRLINGPLYSVNPIAVKQNLQILTENKRKITELKTDGFGTILYLEIGATMVGSIHETFIPNKLYKKGEEKGYFSFGGSCIILLFEPSKIKFDSDLVNNSSQHIETLCLFGQSLGTKN